LSKAVDHVSDCVRIGEIMDDSLCRGEVGGWSAATCIAADRAARSTALTRGGFGVASDNEMLVSKRYGGLDLLQAR